MTNLKYSILDELKSEMEISQSVLTNAVLKNDIKTIKIFKKRYAIYKKAWQMLACTSFTEFDEEDYNEEDLFREED